MIVIPDVLLEEEAAAVHAHLQKLSFVDGKLTARGIARDVKNNLQLDAGNDQRDAVDQLILHALSKNVLLSAWGQPIRFSAPLLNRYEGGMEYGWHVDDPLSFGAQLARRDLSMTLFLSPPESYEGGELEVETPSGPQAIKLPAGQAFVYTTNLLHRVRPVTSGVRYAAVVWMQSLIADDQLRKSLFDLSAAISGLENDASHKEELLLLNKVRQNLTRHFACV